MMTDVDRELRRAIGDPPADPSARERALVRLRAEVVQTQISSDRRSQKGSRRLRVLAAGIALVIGVLGAIGVASREQPAAATELDRLAQVNRSWSENRPLAPVQIEQVGLSQVGAIDGPSFNMLVKSILTRTVDDKGELQQSIRVVSAEPASAEDEAIWKAMGSPDVVPKAGDVALDTLDPPAYHLPAVSSDPEALLQALRDGSVTGYELDDDGDVFGTIGSLFAEPQLSPDQRVALYNVVGMLDGVELLGDIADPIGRPGVGFSMPVGPSQQILIFNRDTGELLATQEYYANDPAQRWGWQVVNPPS